MQHTFPFPNIILCQIHSTHPLSRELIYKTHKNKMKIRSNDSMCWMQNFVHVCACTNQPRLFPDVPVDFAHTHAYILIQSAFLICSSRLIFMRRTFRRIFMNEKFYVRKMWSKLFFFCFGGNCHACVCDSWPIFIIIIIIFFILKVEKKRLIYSTGTGMFKIEKYSCVQGFYLDYDGFLAIDYIMTSEQMLRNWEKFYNNRKALEISDCDGSV